MTGSDTHNAASIHRAGRGLVTVLLLGFVLRVAIVAWRYEQLSVDTDAYLAIANRLLAGDGFCSVPGQPTAYRPPLFPWLVAISTGSGGTLGLAILQVALGLVTIATTWWLALQLEIGHRSAVIAAGLVAVDPMLLAYSSQAMTEVLMTALTIGFFAALRLPREGWQRATFSGAMFGLLALCRPSVWPFALLAGSWSTLKSYRSRRFNWLEHGSFVLAAGLVLAPWFARNAIVFGRPILTTTHGGYTALLGNNDAFFDAVVSQPFGTVWENSSFERWQQDVEANLKEQGIDRADELGRDAAMKQLAMNWLSHHPTRGMQAAWYRVRNLWSPSPLMSSDVPKIVLVAVSIFYLAAALLALRGVCCSRLDHRFRTLTLLLIFSLTALHAVFWANARMRAPTHPLLAILAVTGAFAPARRDEPAAVSHPM